MRNACIESFNGKGRDERLNQQWFNSLDETREVLAAWREDFKRTRPHFNSGDVAPESFRACWLAAATSGGKPPEVGDSMLPVDQCRGEGHFARINLHPEAVDTGDRTATGHPETARALALESVDR